MQREGVLVVGSANMDLVLSVEKFPHPGETTFGKKFQMFPGGKGSNQAVCCAKLGARTLFICKMGNDEFRKSLSDNMTAQGVDLNYLLIDDEESTGTALITVDGEGQNEIIVISGSNMRLTPENIDDCREIFNEVKVVVAQLEVPIATVLKTAKIAKEAGNIFILNPAPAQELSTELLSFVDYLTPNETELEMLSGTPVKDDRSIDTAAGKLLSRGVKNVVVTLGDRGARLINKNISETFPANRVKVIDSTGAGDAFNGALAFALGNDEDIEKAVKFAISVASFSVTKMGAQSSLPTPEEIAEVIHS